MSTPKTYRILTVAMPIGVFLIAAAMIAMQWVQLRGAEDESTQVKANIGFLDNMIASYQTWSAKIPKLADYDTEAEQTAFLTDLRMKAAQAEVEIVKFANVMKAPSSGEAPADPANPNKKSAIPEITPKSSTVEVAGDYQKVRDFMYAVLRSDRLLNVSNIMWQRTESPEKPKDTKISFNITRYVTRASAAAPQQPAAVGAATNPSEVSQ
jgi:Tfp pilus assembly protein PilO